MSTISETLFEQLCAARSIPCSRIPTSTTKTPDFEIVLGIQRVAVEIKQLDPNAEDARLHAALYAGEDIDGVSSPAPRVREQIAAGYRQLKPIALRVLPAILLLYNDSGMLNFLDSFTVTTAMFGTYGVRIALGKSGSIVTTAQKFMGNRRVTRNHCKLLSAVGVLNDALSARPGITLYHNPFAVVPLAPSVARLLADMQLRHENPDTGDFVPWEPSTVGA